MRFFLSYIPECKSVKKQLKELAGKKGLICTDRPYDTVLNKMKAVMMKGTCLQGKESYRRIVVGIPVDNGLYLMEICCPDRAGDMTFRLQ